MMETFKTLPALQMGEAVKLAWKNITKFQGRSRRSEFWWTVLAVFIASVVLSFIPFLGTILVLLMEIALIPLIFRRLHDTGRSGWWWGGSLLIQLIGCVIILPSLYTMVVTMGMDTVSQRSAETFLASIFTVQACIWYFVNFVYSIVMLVFLCSDSQKDDNKYGPSPKYVPEGEQDYVEVVL